MYRCRRYQRLQDFRLMFESIPAYDNEESIPVWKDPEMD